MGKWIVVSLALALGLLSPPGAAAYRGTVTIAMNNEPTTMDPHAVSDFVGAIVWRWSYDTLVSSEAATGRIIPWLAERWERVSPKAVKFYLRRGVRFTDGTPVTSAAVKYSVGRIWDPELRSAQRSFIQSFDRIEVLDDTTFIWHTKQPDNGALNPLIRWGNVMSPRTKGWDKARISRTTVGSGPYVLQSWTKGQKMVFEANPNWFLNDRYPDRPKTVILRRIQESATRVKALVAGEVDIILGVTPPMVPEIGKDPGTALVSVPALRILHLGFLGRHGGPFADVNVRKAVNYAIDAELIRKTILQGRADPIAQMFHPWVYAGYNPNKTWYGYDLAKAKELLKSSSHPDGFKAELLTTAGRYPGDRATCEAVAGMLKEIKIDTSCNAMNFPLYRSVFQAYQSGKRKGAAMYFMGFGNAAGDPALAMRTTVACKGAWSGTCFKELDEAIEKAAGTVDPAEQQAAFERVTDMMKERATHKFFYKVHDIFGYRKGLRFRPSHDETLYVWEVVAK